MSHRRFKTNYDTRQIGNAVDYQKIKAEAYHGQGIAIIDLADSRIPWEDREIIEGACRKLYGQRSANG